MDTTSPQFKAQLADGPIRIDGVTYFLYRGEVRICKSIRGPKKTRMKGEELPVSNYKEVREIWREYRQVTWGLPIWNTWAKETGATKSNKLFFTLNGDCIRPGEGVWAFSKYIFSVGSLEAPAITKAERNEWTVTLEWEYQAKKSKADAADQVYLGYFYDTLPRSPRFIKNLPARRGDGKLTVEIPAGEQPDGTPLHLYLFFGNENPYRFSPSEYAKV